MLGLHCWAGFSLVSETGSYSLIVVCGLLITVASPVVEYRLQGGWAQELCSLKSLVAPRHVGSSKTKEETHVSWIGRQILYHRATREALKYCLVYLATLSLNCGMRDLQLQHVGSSSLTRGRTRAPSIGNIEY